MRFRLGDLVHDVTNCTIVMGILNRTPDSFFDGGQFHAIEAEGGILQSLVDGKVQSRIVAARHKRAAAYRSGERRLVGTTLHPLTSERTFPTLEASRRKVEQDAAVSCEPLQPTRIDETVGPLQ